MRSKSQVRVNPKAFLVYLGYLTSMTLSNRESYHGIDPRELKEGLTWRSLLAIVLTAGMYIPVNIFTSLLLGGGVVGIAAVAFTTLLFTELVRYSFTPLSRQEVLMVYYGASIATGGTGLIYNLIIYRSYFVNSPFAWSAEVNGVPLALLVPEWLAPRYGSPAYEVRTLFQPAYVPSLVVYSVRLVLTVIAQLTLAMLVARVYLQAEEGFPFPLAQVDNAMVAFISQRTSNITRIFMFSMIPGLIYASMAYVGPILLNMMFIPIPYLDLTLYLRDYIPGAAIGISTMLTVFVGGMIIPFINTVYILAGSITVWIVLNSLFATTYADLFPRWSSEFFKGMGLAAIQQRSMVTVWFAPQIGFTLAAALYMIYKVRKPLFSVFRTISKKGSTLDVLGFTDTGKLLAIFIVSTVASIALHQYLLPTLPIWIPIFAAMGYSFLLALVLTAEQGVVGTVVSPTFVWQSLVYVSPYQGYGAFVFEPLDLSNVGGIAPTFTQQVKVALLNRAKPMDLIKLQIIASIMVSILGLLSLNFFWNIAPMPSTAYPATLYTMPGSAQVDVFTATRQLAFTPQSLLVPAAILLVLCMAGDVASKFGFPFSLVGLFMGPFMYPTQAIPLFVGSAISRFVMVRYFKDRWNMMRGPVVGGVALGEGFVIMLVMSVKLMSSSAWIWPW